MYEFTFHKFRIATDHWTHPKISTSIQSNYWKSSEFHLPPWTAVSTGIWASSRGCWRPPRWRTSSLSCTVAVCHNGHSGGSRTKSECAGRMQVNRFIRGGATWSPYACWARAQRVWGARSSQARRTGSEGVEEGRRRHGFRSKLRGAEGEWMGNGFSVWSLDV